jgi:hypothetical protein
LKLVTTEVSIVSAINGEIQNFLQKNTRSNLRLQSENETVIGLVLEIHGQIWLHGCCHDRRIVYLMVQQPVISSMTMKS